MSLKEFFSFIIPELVENGCLDKFLLISTYPLHSMHVRLFTISVKNQASLVRKTVGSSSWV